MPYIPPDDRENLGLTLKRMPATPAELCYVFYKIAISYAKAHGFQSWDVLSDVDKALSGAAKEFYRRHTAPHEDRKIKENGDVY
jgi:hypothetical protein